MGANEAVTVELGAPNPALTPPTSEDIQNKGGSSSGLSDVDMDDDNDDDEEEIFPDHYYDGGRIPVFKPVCWPSFLTA